MSVLVEEAVIRTWHDNAVEFLVLSKQGVDVRLAVLVACSVEKGKAGRPPLNATDVAIKVSTRAFAEKANTTDPRIARHLDAWNECAAKGWCRPSSELVPDDASRADLRVPTQEQFISQFQADKSGGRPRASIDEIADRAVEDPEYKKKLVDTIDKKERESRKKAIDEAVIELEEKGRTIGATGADLKATEALVQARNAVSDWLILVHEAAVKSKAALALVEKVSEDITDNDIKEALPSLVDTEANAAILRSRLADIGSTRKQG